MSHESPNPELRWIRIQAVSGLTFSLFLAVHLVNTMIGTRGLEAYDGFQSGARAFYQNPIVELLVVLLPLAVHMVASVVRMVRRRRRGGRGVRSMRIRLHRYSGWFLLAVIIGHVSATRGVGFAFEAPAGFGALNFSIVFLPALFLPYYILLGVCGLYHLCSGLMIACQVFGLRVPAWVREGPGFWVPVSLGAIVIVLAVLSFAGVFFEIPRESWGEFGRVYAELMGTAVDEL